MSVFSAVIYEWVDTKTGQTIFLPLIAAGIFSIIYWIVFDDLRWYALVQLLPVPLILVIVFFFHSGYKSRKWLLGMFAGYIIAKIFEHFDGEVFSMLKAVSGHTLKHLFASLSVFLIIVMIRKRKFVH
jgi:hypothetical protein